MKPLQNCYAKCAITLDFGVCPINYARKARLNAHDGVSRVSFARREGSDDAALSDLSLYCSPMR